MFGNIIQLLMMIPQLVKGLKALYQFYVDLQHQGAVQQNEDIKKEILNAQTQEEKQAALNAAQSHIHK